MFAKAPMATHIVSQVCFDAEVICGWIRAVRQRGTDLPIWIGVPGCVPRAKLLRLSMKIGPRRVGPLPAPQPRLAVAAPRAALHPR